MDGFWVQFLVALAAGVCGAALTLLVVNRTRRTPGGAVSAPPPPFVPPARPEYWRHQVQRCEQAVLRAARAVDAVSSAQARNGLQAVVRRMEAELPNVRALAELGRGLPDGSPHGDEVLPRLRSQLEDAAARFGMVTDHVLEAVVELVADPDLSRVHGQVEVLRDQFPLLRPMSAVFGPAGPPSRSLLPVA